MSDPVELPPMPYMDAAFKKFGDWIYSAEDMRAFATAAVLQERERCAALCEGQGPSEAYDPEKGIEERAFAQCAAAIRKG